jgi:hypothetical protein
MKSTNTEWANGVARFDAALLPTTVGGGRVLCCCTAGRRRPGSRDWSRRRRGAPWPCRRAGDARRTGGGPTHRAWSSSSGVGGGRGGPLGWTQSRRPMRDSRKAADAKFRIQSGYEQQNRSKF